MALRTQAPAPREPVAPAPVVAPRQDFGFNSFAPAAPGPMSMEPSLLDGGVCGPAPQVAPPAQTTAPVGPPAPAQEPAQPAPVDPAQTAARATALWRAMDGWGTNEDSVMSTLRGLRPEEIAAIRQEFQAHYGADLDAMIGDEMGGDDLAEAQALLTADPVGSALIGLENSLGTFNDDEGKIEEIMRGLSPEDRQRMQTDPRYADTWRRVQGEVADSLGGADLDVFNALSEGDTATAAAARLDDAMGSSSAWYDPTAWGTDEEAVYTELARLPPDQRSEIEARFNERMAARGEDTTLAAQLGDELSGADADRATAVLTGATVDEQVARIAQTMEGMGTNEGELFRLLEDPSLDADTRDKIAARYEELHGVSLGVAVGDETSGTDLERAQGAIAGNGQQDPAFMLFYSMEGMGTDEALMRETLRGKSAEDIATIRANWNSTYAERYGADFDTAFDEELSGREHFDLVEIGLRGEPQNDQERAEILEMQYSYERGERSTAFGRGYMDALDAVGFSSSASQMDRQHDRLQALYDENGEIAAPEGAVEQLYGWGQDDLQDYRTAKDAATDALATGAEITVAAVATVLTKGAASPWLVAVIAGVAGGTAGMLTKAAVQGEAYGREAIGADALKTVLSAGIAGGAEVGMVTARIKEIAGVFGDDLAREIAEGALKGGLTGFGNGAVTGAMNEDALRAGLGEYLLSIGQGAGLGTLTGAGSGAASKGTEGLIGDRLNRQTLTGEVLMGGITNAAGGVAETAMNAGTWTGRTEDVLGRFGMAAGKGFASGGLNGAVDYQTRARNVARQVTHEGKDLAAIDDAEHLSPDQKREVMERILAYELANTDPAAATLDAPTPIVRQADPEVVRPPEALAVALEENALRTDSPEATPAVETTPAVSETPAPVDVEAEQAADLRRFREQMVLNELVRLEAGGNQEFVDAVLMNSDNVDLMEQMLIRANGGSVAGGGSALGGLDASTPEGALQLLTTGGIPKAQLDALDPASLDAMSRYARAYSSGDLDAATAAHAELAGVLPANTLTLVEGALVAHHYGLQGAQDVGLGPHARASQVLNDGFEASPEELAGFQTYLGDRYEQYLQTVRSRVPPDHPAWSSMSEQELVAVYGYTTNDYAVLNPALRGLDGAALAELMPYIAAAESGLQKLPSVEDALGGPQTTIRGTNIPADVDAQLQPGSSFSDRAFFSTSMEALDNFKGNVEFHVEGSTGRSVEFLSEYAHELEVLYPAGSSFSVLERTVDPQTGRTVIRLKESN